MSDAKHDILYDSPVERKKEREKDILNIIIYDKNSILKPQVLKTISFKPNEYPKLLTFIELAERERTSFAEKKGFTSCVKRAMWDYLKAHPLPNPQLTLERSINLDMPVKPSNVCCVPHCRTTARYILMLKNFKGDVERFPVCYKHRNWKHKTFRWLVGKKELKP